MLKDYKFKEILPGLLHEISQKFNRIKSSGKKDSLAWDQEAEKFVLF